MLSAAVPEQMLLLVDRKRMVEKQAHSLPTELEKKAEDAALFNKAALTCNVAWLYPCTDQRRYW